jgi:hypothetical protein
METGKAGNHLAQKKPEVLRTPPGYNGARPIKTIFTINFYLTNPKQKYGFFYIFQAFICVYANKNGHHLFFPD